MKTIIARKGTQISALAVLLLKVLTLFSTFAPAARAATDGPVTLDTYPSYGTAVTVTSMGPIGDSSQSTVVIPPAFWSSAIPRFSTRLSSTNGQNGTMAIQTATVSLTINGAPGLDGFNQPITNRPINIYDLVGDGITPCTYGISAQNTLTSIPNTPVAGSVLFNTNRLISEALEYRPTGSARRPFFMAPGQYYAVRYAFTGTFDGQPFEVSETAYVVTAPVTPTGFTITACTPESVTLGWVDVVGETGYRVEQSLDGGETWQTVSPLDPNQTSLNITGLDVPYKDYLFRLIALGVTEGGKSAPAGPVAPRRVVSQRVDLESQRWIIEVRGTSVVIDDIQVSSDLVDWGPLPEGSTLTATGPYTSQVRVPVNGINRQFLRVCWPSQVNN